MRSCFDRWWQTDGRENYRVWKAFEQLSLHHPLVTFHTLVSRYSYLFRLVWPQRARVTYVRCLDGVWLRLVPDQLAAARVKAQPDQQAFHLVLQALHRLQARAQEQGASVLVVVQPSKEATYLPLLGNTGARPAACPAGQPWPSAASPCSTSPRSFVTGQLSGRDSSFRSMALPMHGDSC